MKNIKSIVVNHLRVIAVIMSLAIIVMMLFIQFIRDQELNRANAYDMFLQIEKLLEENSEELESVRAEYSRECLKNADTIANIIQSSPEVLEDLDKLRYIAEIVNVDEVHLFNEDGVIFNGTHPEYYNMSVDDGEQIGFFKQMLADKSLKLVQPLTPNTANGSMIQYSAVWSTNGEFFVQVGMRQENVLKVTEKNEMPYIFSLLKVSSDVDLYSADPESGKIIGSTVKGMEGKSLSELGIPYEKAKTDADGFHANVNGRISFCMFSECGGLLIGCIIAAESMYSGALTGIALLALGIILVTVIMMIAITRFISKEIITEIDGINEKLEQITDGNLDECVDASNCLEFNELSKHINDMIASLLSSTDKISYVLDKADLQIGVYEYNEKMRSVRFTKKVSKILSLNDEEVEKLSGSCALFKEYIRACIFDSVSPKENIFRLYGETEKYVKHEEFSSNNSILGIIMDVTEDYNHRKQLEIERDIDALTGLLNRRGLDSRLESMFRHPENLGCGALVMLDADGLKAVNDRYGHDAGDEYLRAIARALSSLGSKNCLCARQGGDEFVLFLHNLEKKAQAEAYLKRLYELQSEYSAEVAKGETVPISFSFGAASLDGTSDFGALLKTADERMYSNKRCRKMERV